METSNKLSYSKTHLFVEDGTQYKIIAKVSLMMIARTEYMILALRRTFTRKEKTVVLFMLAAGVAMKKYRNVARNLQSSFPCTCVITTARQCTRKQTDFITCKIAEKKPL